MKKAEIITVVASVAIVGVLVIFLKSQSQLDNSEAQASDQGESSIATQSPGQSSVITPDFLEKEGAVFASSYVTNLPEHYRSVIIEGRNEVRSGNENLLGSLAIAYWMASGVDKAEARAAGVYDAVELCATPAAEKGLVFVQRLLAEKFRLDHELETQGVIEAFEQRGSRSIDKAIYWLRRAAEGGSGSAGWSLFRTYSEGEDVPADMSEAIRYCQLAAESDDGLFLDEDRSRAMASLSLAYLKGVGVPKDLLEAYKWANLAVYFDETLEGGEKIREALTKSMNGEDVLQAQKLSTEWIKAR